MEYAVARVSLPLRLPLTVTPPEVAALDTNKVAPADTLSTEAGMDVWIVGHRLAD